MGVQIMIDKINEIPPMKLNIELGNRNREDEHDKDKFLQVLNTEVKRYGKSREQRRESV